MINIEKVLSEKIISKSSNAASADIIEIIIKKIVKNYEHDNLTFFKETTNSDEKIEMYLFWKKICLGIIETDIKTDNYSFKHYACCFLDDELRHIYLTYIFHENEFYDVSILREF
jgi:hypothetical protein